MSDEPIRPGYKRTEVGIIPEDWEVTTIGDIFRVSAAGDLDKTRFSAIRDANYDKPIYSNALENKGLYGYASYSIYPAGTITVTARGTLGFAVFRDHDYVAIGRLLILEPSRKLDSRYFTEWINNRITFAVESTGVPQLTAPQISKYRLPLPSQLEQHVIADVLSDVDALLDALDRLIAKKRAIKQGTMQALLTGRVRLPGFTSNPSYKHTEVGEIPEDWEVCPFGQLVNIRNDKVNPALVDPSTPCVELENIGQGTGQLTGYSLAEQSTSIKYRFLESDVLYGRLRAYLRKFWFAEFNGICTTEIWPLKPVGEQMRSEYLFQVVQTDRFNEAASMTYGTHMPRTDWSVISNLLIPVPDPSEQCAIAEVLSDMDAEIDALEKRRAKLRDIKQGMMQELLTGRIRLVQPKEQTKEAHV